MTDANDRWAAGSTYEDFMGRWSRKLAPQLVSWLGIPRGMHWLDVGCGTGALTAAICEYAAPASVTGCDPAEPFVEYARQHSSDPRATFAVAGAGSLPQHEQGYGSITSLLALNFDDYWTPFLGGTEPAPSYVASLDNERRAALTSKLDGTLPRQADGAIALVARAWAVRGAAG